MIKRRAFAETVIDFNGETLILNTKKSLFFESHRTLVLSDCHLGKATHFRKNAIPLSLKAADRDLIEIEALIEYYQPEQMVFLGDLFHSSHNREWEAFCRLMKKCSLNQAVLVRGNHDILNEHHYDDAGLKLTDKLLVGEINLVHDIPASPDPESYYISGHIHPGYRISGTARQSAVLPCFFCSRNHLIMPAFGSLTGLKKLEKQNNSDCVYCFTETAFFEL